MAQLRRLPGQLVIAWKHHWPYYVAEAMGLACFLCCASMATVLLQHPASPVRQALNSAIARRSVLGVVMGLVSVSIAYSSWGKRSGAHINPAVPLAFWWLGSISSVDALWCVVAQSTGAIAAGQLMFLVLGRLYADSPVHYVMTKPMPQPLGEPIAFAAEFVISLLMMFLLLWALQNKKIKDKAGWLVGGLIAVYILVESPYSGMSLNPARSVGSAVAAGDYHGLWVYWLAPPAAMWTAALLFRRFCQRALSSRALGTGCRPDSCLPHYPQDKVGAE